MRAEPFEATGREWDAFVEQQAGATHFHRWAWREIVSDVHGHPCPYLAIRDADGELAGVLPLVRVSSRLFGDYLVSMPYVNYGGPLGSEWAVRALAEQARSLAGASDALLELRSRRELPVELPVSHRKVTVTLELPAGEPETLWKALDSKVRSQVRRPRKAGAEVRFGPEWLDDFYRLYTDRMHGLGTPAQPRELFAALRDRAAEDVWFGVVLLDGRGICWDDEVEMAWAADDIVYRKQAPNMLLYWSFMERAAEEGLTTFNFGRCTPGSGTHRFKKQWGGEDETLWWYHAGAGEREHTPTPDEGRWAWAPKVWRKLPEAVVDAVGPRLARYLP